LQTNLHGRRSAPRGPSHGAVGQPDPMRTSIDLMGKGGGGGRNRNRSGGGGGGGYGGNRSGGGGGGGNRRGGFSR
ncbi:MAG TPA: RNA helicase, partial [Ottowia beijingensis]|nr:RNA helicase [Ottowia beijingensis]